MRKHRTLVDGIGRSNRKHRMPTRSIASRNFSSVIKNLWIMNMLRAPCRAPGKAYMFFRWVGGRAAAAECVQLAAPLRFSSRLTARTKARRARTPRAVCCAAAYVESGRESTDSGGLLLCSSPKALRIATSRRVHSLRSARGDA